MRTAISTALAVILLLTACSDGADTPVIPGSMTVAPNAAPEGDPGEMRILALRASLTEPRSDTVRVRYSTSAGTATAGVDYLDTAGELEIPPGDLHTFIAIEMIGDAEEEPAETINVRLETDGNASLTASEVIATIANDDSTCDEAFDNVPNPWLVNGADPLNFAHRGGVRDFPENTLYAYAEAALAGADVLEMDVYQSKDGELVILHDLTVDRTTDGSGAVADLTLAELRALDAAYWFVQGEGTPRGRPEEDYLFRGIATGDKPPPPGYSAEDFRIPTLEEALARFPRELINLELKPDDGEGNYEAQMAELLQRYGRSTDVIAGSFQGPVTRLFKEFAPCVYSYIPLDQGLEIGLDFLFGSGVMPPVPEHISWQVPPNTEQIGDELDLDIPVVTEEFVEAAHSVDLAVQVWTINTCEEMLQMIDLEVDAIMTDEPLLLERLLSMPPDQRSCEGEE